MFLNLRLGNMPAWYALGTLLAANLVGQLKGQVMTRLALHAEAGLCLQGKARV